MSKNLILCNIFTIIFFLHYQSSGFIRNDQNGLSTCDPGMLKKLQEYIVNDKDKPDARWDELKNLIKN